MFGLSRLSPVQLIVLLVIGVLVFGAPILRSLTDPLHFVSLILGLIVGITVHEASHATVAVLLGDPTPRMMGRVSLNPLRHLDPMGSIAMLIASFGWGKPVVFNPSRLHGDPRIGSALVVHLASCAAAKSCCWVVPGSSPALTAGVRKSRPPATRTDDVGPSSTQPSLEM